MRTDLLSRPCFTRAQLYVSRYQLVSAVHLALVGQDALPTTTGRVDRQRLLEALLDVGGPDALRVLALRLLVVVDRGAGVRGGLLGETSRRAL